MKMSFSWSTENLGGGHKKLEVLEVLEVLVEDFDRFWWRTNLGGELKKTHTFVCGGFSPNLF